jgi:hypothetical protein
MVTACLIFLAIIIGLMAWFIIHQQVELEKQRRQDKAASDQFWQQNQGERDETL